MSYSLIDLSENAQDNRYPITNDFGLLYQQIAIKRTVEAIAKGQERLLLVMAKYLLAGLAKNKTMEQINRVIIKLFKEVKSAYLKTITFDNGREFCGHGQLSESLKIQYFFTNPYHSWECGLNEHANGLIRQFYPKSTNFKIVEEEDFQKVVNLINYRPRKSFDYRTPHEVFFGSSEPVALQI